MKPIVIPFTLALCVLAAPAAIAQSALGLETIGASVGFVSPEDLGSTFSLGAYAGCGTIAPNVGLETRLDYWSTSENVYGFESSLRDIALGARAKYFFNVTGSTIRPFAGGGLGIHFLRAEVTIPAFFGMPAQSASESDTKFGVDMGGGFATALSPKYDLIGEAWFGIVSNLNQLSLRVGLSYKLGS